MSKKKMFFSGGADDGIPRDKLTYYAGCEGAIPDTTTLRNWVNNELAEDIASLALSSTLVGDGVRMMSNVSRYKMPSSYDYSLLDSVNGEVPVSVGFIANGDFTNAGTGAWLMNKRGNPIDGGGVDLEFQINTGTNGALRTVFFTDGSNFLLVETTTLLTNNVDTCVSVTYDGSKNASGIKMYFDGVLQPVTDLSSGTYTGMVKGDADLGIAHRNWQVNAGWTNGIMDEIHIFKNVELDQNQVTTIYNKFLNGEHLIPEPSI